jgi:YHS domain-containing protein
VQDPQRYLTFHEIELPGIVYPERKAILIPGMEAKVNHEIYFFSSSAARAKFLKDPLRFCGTLTDPVSHERFEPTKRSPRFDYAKRPYFFTSDSTRKIFVAAPDTYAERSGG